METWSREVPRPPRRVGTWSNLQFTRLRRVAGRSNKVFTRLISSESGVIYNLLVHARLGEGLVSLTTPYFRPREAFVNTTNPHAGYMKEFTPDFPVSPTFFFFARRGFIFAQKNRTNDDEECRFKG